MVQLATHEWHPVDTDAAADAPVAVLVHGIVGWWRTWWRVGPALAERGWRVIAVDLHGHGESQRIEGVATRADMGADLARTIEALDVAPVDAVIGHSMGAAVVLEMAHARPRLLRRAVLEDPPGTDRSTDFDYQARLERDLRAAREHPDEQQARQLVANPAWLEEDARQSVEGQQRCDLSGILASLRGGMGSRVPELAGRLAVPALYLLAPESRSAIWGEPRARLLERVPPGSRAVEVDSGHTIHRDRFERYMELMRGWLDG